MIYLFENPENLASVVYDESTIDEATKAKGIAVEELPVANTPQGKMAILKVNKKEERVWYDYIDEPKDDELEQLKAHVADLFELVLMGGM